MSHRYRDAFGILRGTPCTDDHPTQPIPRQSLAECAEQGLVRKESER